MIGHKLLCPLFCLFYAVNVGAEPCGMVTFEGECMGNILRYCSDGVLVEIDCTTDYTANSVCREIDPAYGFGCAVAVGEQCYYEDVDEQVIVVPCQGMNPGCLENASTAVCAENLGSCTQADLFTCTARGLLVFCPEFKQPNILDCASLGGRCSPRRCADIPVGGYCDDLNAFCASGLVCNNSACVPGGVMPPEDAGIADRSSLDVMAPTRPDVGFGFPDEDAGSSMNARNPGSSDETDNTGRRGPIRGEDSDCSCAAVLRARPVGSLFELCSFALILGLGFVRRRKT